MGIEEQQSPTTNGVLPVLDADTHSLRAQSVIPHTMRSAVIAAPGQLQVRSVPIPHAYGQEVVVRLEGCGVCGSNLPVWEGREWFEYPHQPGKPGHEGWGRVVQTGPAVEDVTIGDRVAMLSQNAFAEYDIVDSRALVVIPADLDGLPFPGEPLGCALNVFARSSIMPGQTVSIVGIGSLGILLCQLAVHAGAKVIAISRRQYALQLAHQLGAHHTVQLKDSSTVCDQVRAITNEKGCERVIEAVGHQSTLDLASQLTTVRGRLVIAGYHQDGLRQVNMQMWNWRGIDVINAHERDQRTYVAGMRAALAAVLEGRINPSVLYTHQYPLEQLDLAFAIMKQRPDGFMKAIITF